MEEQKDGARAAATADKKKGILGPLTELDTKGILSYAVTSFPEWKMPFFLESSVSLVAEPRLCE